MRTHNVRFLKLQNAEESLTFGGRRGDPEKVIQFSLDRHCSVSAPITP